MDQIDFRVVEVEECDHGTKTGFELLVMDDWSCPLVVASYKHEIFNYFNDDIPQDIKPGWKGFDDPTIPCVSVSDSYLFVERCEHFMLRE